MFTLLHSFRTCSNTEVLWRREARSCVFVLIGRQGVTEPESSALKPMAALASHTRPRERERDQGLDFDKQKGEDKEATRKRHCEVQDIKILETDKSMRCSVRRGSLYVTGA